MPDKIYSISELREMFADKKLYERTIVDGKIKVVPTEKELQLRLIIANGQYRKEDFGNGAPSDYFRLQL